MELRMGRLWSLRHKSMDAGGIDGIGLGVLISRDAFEQASIRR